MFAEKGYTGVEIDITAPTGFGEKPGFDSAAIGQSGGEMEYKSVLDSMTTMLASQIRLMAIPFAPIIIASGKSSTALTQNYISSHPASGLVLVNPGEGEMEESLFNYEPSFPILVINEKGQHGGRLGRAAAQGVGRGGKGVEVERAPDGERGEKTRVVSPFFPEVLTCFEASDLARRQAHWGGPRLTRTGCGTMDGQMRVLNFRSTEVRAPPIPQNPSLQALAPPCGGYMYISDAHQSVSLPEIL